MEVLSLSWRGSGGKPFETFGKDSILLRRRKHGTTDQLALPHQYRQKGEIAETVRSAPGRDPRMARFIRILNAMARETGRIGLRPRGWEPARLDTTMPCSVFRPDFRDFIAAFRGIDD